MSQQNGGLLIKFNPLTIQVIEDSTKHYQDISDTIAEGTFVPKFDPDLIIWVTEFSTMVKYKFDVTYDMQIETMKEILENHQIEYTFDEVWDAFCIGGYTFSL